MVDGQKTLLVQLDAELHRRLLINKANTGMSMKDQITTALEKYLGISNS